MVNSTQSSAMQTARLWDLLESVKDPEVPVLSIRDLGVLRDVRIEPRRVLVVITPTYSGCPAMLAIRREVEACLIGAGYDDAVIETRLAPAWTTDWISPEGHEKLRRYGIAPPQPAWPGKPIECPTCGSSHTRIVSEFGSTACKALFQCDRCLEPFDYFKCL